MHPPSHDSECDCRRRRQLDILRRFHVRRQIIVVRQVDALRRNRIVFHVPAVAAIDRRLARQSRRHRVERVVVAGGFAGRL